VAKSTVGYCFHSTFRTIALTDYSTGLNFNGEKYELQPERKLGHWRTLLRPATIDVYV